MHTRGFTIIELVITLAIVGLMATAAMPLAQLVAKRSALDAYKVASDTGHIPKELGASGYPPDLKSLYAGVEDAASEKKVMLYFLRRLPRDPFFPDGTVPPEQSWGLRSYASPPDDPQPGDDVYDIYSLDKGVGLNEVHYHDW